MAKEIRHVVGIKASPQKIYDALTTLKGLSGWWTTDVRGDSRKGGRLEFWFEENASILRVVDLKKNRYVQWKSLDGYGFEGTQLSFTIQKSKGECFVFLRHWGWKKTDFMFDFCSTKWATFMLSLKDLIEKGKGKPFPRDTQIIHADVG